MEVRYTAGFDGDLDRLRDSRLRRRLDRVINELEAAPRLTEAPGIRRLTGVGPRYRIRIGKHRLIILLEGNVAYLERFLRRSNAYRELR